MHSLMFHRYQKLLLVCGSEGVLVWCFAGYRKVPKPLASVPKKSVVKLKRDTANKAGSMKKQVLCMQRQCLKSSATLVSMLFAVVQVNTLPGTATYASYALRTYKGHASKPDDLIVCLSGPVCATVDADLLGSLLPG